jgi:hypothetical protein
MMSRMGAWGTGTFDNDDAADWAYELEEAIDLSPVREALAAATDGDGYLERPEGAVAVAAAAVLAATFDGDLRGLPDDVGEWVDGQPGTSTPGDARLALDALVRVVSEDSELRELWEDSPDGRKWALGIEQLGQRLQASLGQE